MSHPEGTTPGLEGSAQGRALGTHHARAFSAAWCTPRWTVAVTMLACRSHWVRHSDPAQGWRRDRAWQASEAPRTLPPWPGGRTWNRSYSEHPVRHTCHFIARSFTTHTATCATHWVRVSTRRAATMRAPSAAPCACPRIASPRGCARSSYCQVSNRCFSRSS